MYYKIIFAVGVLLVALLILHRSYRSNSFIKQVVELYTYAYPAVIVEVTKNSMTNVSAPTISSGHAAAPINQFAHATVFPTPEFKDIVRPNLDTLYSVAWLDLTQEPIILSVPDTHGRYYLMPLLDAWTNVFASLGARTTGTKAQDFVIVGPGWQGTVPNHLTLVQAPTNTVWILGRTQTNGKNDYAYVHAIQKGYRLTPLSAWGNPYRPPVQDPVITPTQHDAPVDQVAAMNAQEFFGTFARVMAKNPPPAPDARMMEFFKKIATMPTDVQSDVHKAMALAKSSMARDASRLGEHVHGWLFMRSGIGAYGTDYLTRALVAFIGIGANLPQDAVYPTAFVDADGVALDGAHNYLLHFDREAIPPVHAFWSVTMYDAQSFLVPNSLDRYALGDRDELTCNEDGSLDIFIQHAAPDDRYRSNWLPAPTGSFNLTLRLYWPKESVLDGSWNPPPVRRVKMATMVGV